MFFHQVQKKISILRVSFHLVPFISVRTDCLSQLQSLDIHRKIQRIEENEFVNIKSHHMKNEHKIMSNKHHLREFQVDFFMSLWCFSSSCSCVPYSRFDFGLKEEKCKQKMNREHNKRRLPTRQQQHNRKIELSKSVQLI